MAASQKKWSAGVTAHSDALDLEGHIFESKDELRKAFGREPE